MYVRIYAIFYQAVLLDIQHIYQRIYKLLCDYLSNIFFFDKELFSFPKSMILPIKALYNFSVDIVV